MGAVAVYDIRTRTIPNWLVAVGAFCGVILAVQSGGIADAIQGIAVAFALGIVPFALRALGAGDVKASMAIGSFVGVLGILKIILATALISGAIAWLWWTIQRFQPSDKVSTIPVGAALAIATWIFTASYWMN